ncbi:phosphomevalonate kinase [Streptomyces sp. NK15101]|uniref:phosphomevalonate kinase n=1 Tax=Streptomyces sp. NK15101 TaxID=2873261 RepID=UPI001CECE8E5|nr:phosphomevalonate kinase [Streptomyces sp. NK15101]
MTAGPAITRQAPGKLFIAGEYAVLEPGRPAILVAVDRHIGVTVSAADEADVVIETDLVPRGARLRRGDGGLVADEPGARDRLGPVVSAIELVDALLAERGRSTSPVRVSIASTLHRDGTKFGLGSSGAVTVATVDALAAYHGMELPADDLYRLALLATARHDPRSSGGDLAASVWGGWIAYQAPDRAAVLDMARCEGIEQTLRAPWPGFGLRRLPPPRGLALEVGWTGEPASTASLAGRLETPEWHGSAARRDFIARSDACVRAAIHALERGDDDELLHRIRGARSMLADLDDAVRLGIFTPGLTALCDAAESVGGAAKPSGAGGGDCGIALLDATAAPKVSRLHQRWAAAGVLPLPLHIQPTKASAA